MVGRQRVRRKVARVSQDDSISEEIENTNSSIIEVRGGSQKVILVSSDEEPEVVRKHRKVASISSLSKRLLSRENSTLQTSTSGESWVDKYRPKTSKDIAMHPRKLKEIETSLKEMAGTENDKKLLLLSGPAGSGKSTVVRILADEIIGRPFDPTANDEESPNLIEYINGLTPSMNQFLDFLNECKMLTGPNMKVVLLEDIPNVFHLETKLRFQKLLQEWLNTPYKLPPLVICLSETEFNDSGTGELSYSIQNNFVAETVIGPSLLANRHLQRIKVNSIAKTYLKKLLSAIIKSEIIFEKIPALVVQAKLDNLSTTGDIRSSINCLEFWARFYIKGKDIGDDDFLSFGKENNMNLFNGIGKIIYGTSHEDGEKINYLKKSTTDQKAMDITKIDEITISNVLSDFSNKSTFFNLNLLENYAVFNGSQFPICQELDEMISNLGISDILNTDGLIELGSNIAVRSTRLNMRSISDKIHDGTFDSIDTKFEKSKNHKLNFSRHYKFLRKLRTIKNDITTYQLWKFNRVNLHGGESNEEYGPMATSLSVNDAILLDGFYEPQILNSHRNEERIRERLAKVEGKSYVPSNLIPKFPRLGGGFSNKLLSDSTIVIEDDYDSFSKRIESYKSEEEKLLSVLTESVGLEESDSEFDEDPIIDEDDEVVRKQPKNEFIDDFNDDDSFVDEDW